ncbi:MFS transporter [Candidatus Pacearchaeota archaeon]|nr:MFS transporter [Candidatus Pacearchaeota archaeon]
MDKKSKIWLLFIVAFVIVAGYTVFIPILPFLVEELGGQESQVGLVIALAPLTTVIFSPILGALTDRWGRRPVILLGMGGMAVWFGLYALASSMTFLYLGSLVGGVFSAGAMAAANAYVSDVTSEEERGKYITRLQAAQMMGAFLPPLAAGFLAGISLRFPFYIMLGIAVLGLILCITALSESLSTEQKEKANAQTEGVLQMVGSSFARLIGYLATPIGPLLIIAFLIALPTGFFETSLPLLVLNLGLSTSQSGIVFSGATLAVVIAQVVIVEKMMKRYGEMANILAGMVSAIIFYILIPFSTGFWMILVINAVLAFTTSQMRPANITLLTKKAPSEEQGLSQAAYNFYTSIGRIIGPILGGILFSQFGGKLTLFIAAFVFGLSFLYTYSVSKKQSAK